MPHRPAHLRQAFTLLELLLVLALLAMAVALVVPSLRGFSHSTRLRGSTDEFAAMAQYARTQAVTTCEVYRITFDPRPTSGQYGPAGKFELLRMEREGQFAPDTDEFRGPLNVPDGCRAELVDLTGKPLGSIDFYPTGRTQPARFSVYDDSTGRISIVECLSPTESFKLVKQEAQR